MLTTGQLHFIMAHPLLIMAHQIITLNNTVEPIAQKMAFTIPRLKHAQVDGKE
jgi:hypothetical protein